MVLDFEYGVNTGNRFLQFVDHDEDPDAFIAAQTQEEEKQKKTAAKDVKSTTKKVTSKTTTVTTTATKTNKENLQTKSTNVDQRRLQSANAPAVFSDNNQQPRGDSARGSRGGSRRGGPPFEGAGRGRSQRFNKFEGQGSSSTNEQSSFDQGGRGQSGRGRGNYEGGRGNYEGGRGNYEGGRGGPSGRGRGRGGRGGFNRNQEEGAPQQQQQDNSDWQQSTESNFDNTRSYSNREFDQEVSPTERQFEPDNTRRGRGSYRGGRSFHSNRNYSDREGGEEDYRANRRQHDRQPRSFVSSVKPIEKKDGEGAHNWGNPTENPEDHQISDEITETTAQTAPASKDWAQQVDEAEKQMTLDEYKKQQEAKRRAHLDKVPQFKTRVAGEGEDPKGWQKYEQEYRKKNDDDESGEEVDEEGSGEEESAEEDEEEHLSGKKKIITIPLRFKPIDIPRGSAGSRGGPRRGGGRFRGNDQPRSTSPSQGQQSPSSQPYDEEQSSYRGGQRGGRGDYHRSSRGSRQGRGKADPNAPSLDNPDDFPTLPKQ